MSRLTGSEARSLMEAYMNVYASQEESLEQEIFEAVAYTLISQGYTAIDVLEYFANTDNEVIVEDVIGISDGTLLFESVVSEEYVEEQVQQLDEIVGAALRIGQAALKGAKFAQKTGMLGKAGGALKAAGTAATRVAQQGAKASAVVRPAIGRAVQAVKGAAAGALSKLPGGASGKLAGAAKFLGKAALGGAAFEGGMRAVQGLAGGAKPSAPVAKTAPTGDKAKYNASAALGGQAAFKAGGGLAAMKKEPKLTAADIQKRGNEALFKAGGGKAAMDGKTRSQVIAQGSKNVAAKAAAPAPAAPAAAPKVAPAAATAKATPAPAAPAGKPATGKLGGTTFERRTPTSAELRGAQAARAAGASPEQALKAAQEAGKRQASVEADLKKANTPSELNKPAPAGSALAAEQERRKKAQQAATTTATESYDSYDLVLEYLIDNGHAETVSEAHYIMLEMDSEMVQNIVEAKYGTAAGRKALAKKIRKGENIGKKGPGTGFGAVEKAAKEGGAEDPTAVAAAAMWKTYGKGKKG